MKDNRKHVFNTDQDQFDQVQLDQGQIDQNQSDQIMEIKHLFSCQPTIYLTELNSYIIVGLMQKETVRSSKLRKLRTFEILVGNLILKKSLQLGQILIF